jgi:cardiolipin synthase
MSRYHVAIIIFEIALALFMAGHAMLYKRDTRSSTFWILLILLVPWLGMALYLLFGINRIRRDAPLISYVDTDGSPDLAPCLMANIAMIPPYRKCWDLKILQNGDEAYPAMLQAIESAHHEILLATYIFDNDPIGKQFVAKLTEAKNRGVDVRILVDGVGYWYSFPPITRALRKAKLWFSVFLPTLRPWSTRFLNLRNHRKLLIVDRQLAFLGGMNIREKNMLSRNPKTPTVDVHFSVRGQVIEDFIWQFNSDWTFATKGLRPIKEWSEEKAQNLTEEILQPTFFARTISDGPDLMVPRLASLLLVRLSEAQSRVRIVTPYFLPDRVFVAALTTAALRGVKIEVILPANNNLPWMRWAIYAMAWQLLSYGIKIFETPGAFDHSKLFTVDGRHSIIGSSNWDARSLRLNFELNMDIECPTITGALDAMIDAKLQTAQALNLKTLDQRSLAVRLRDSASRLFLPVL